VGIQPEQLRLTPDERADLVAYVDGELPEAHSRLISTKLTQSATARREVEILQKTWQMLDYLPLPPATETFASKTISQVRRLELNDHSWAPAVAAWSARLGRVLVYLSLGAVFLGAGFALTRWVWPDPSKRLVEDLTLAEHLDEYLEVGTFEFLGQLADSKEFGTDGQ
jgi:anti-sigma factor RsiW